MIEDKIKYNDYWERVQEKDKEIERLNNVIKRLEEDLRNMYIIFGEFSEDYIDECIKNLKGE